MADPSLTPNPYEPHPDRYCYKAAVNGEYPAVTALRWRSKNDTMRRRASSAEGWW